MTIIIPYRNRPDHLAQFIPHMRAYLPDARIVVVEQVEWQDWNREKLFNVAVRECPDNFYVFHDIDMLPLEVDYAPNQGVTQLAGSKIQLKGYLGGVTMFDHETYVKSGGYHNEYWGGRAGDNEMRFNLQRLKIPVLELHGTFEQLPHPRTGHEFIQHLWYKAQEPRRVQNQLGCCEYRVVERAENEYIHLKVSL